MDLPKNIEELLEKHTLADDVEIDDPDCPICFLPYRSLPSSELPLKAPGCSHIIGRTCLCVWLAENNSCPVCRARVLRPVGAEYLRLYQAAMQAHMNGEALRMRLAGWTMPRYSLNRRSFRMLSPSEPSFWQLCEAVISVMEGVSARSSAPQEWFDAVKYLHIIYSGSLYFFKYLATQDTTSVDYAALVNELRSLVPDPSVVDEVMARARDTSGFPGATPAQIDENMARFEGYYTRVLRARRAMYDRLYPTHLYPVDRYQPFPGHRGMTIPLLRPRLLLRRPSATVRARSSRG
ncbi:MAG: hypothetical protein LQ350_005981 [Teloschistes chrysophthalmus]|nr:MAG: hypothetical protein LQ350_005981 [Niorma chrysophthalma]